MNVNAQIHFRDLPVSHPSGRTHSQLHQLKRKLIRVALEETPETELFKRLCGAANQAAELAWATSYPLLVFPVLFDEMVNAVRARFQQEQISDTQSSLTSVGPVLKLGGAGDPPAPVGDPPTGTGASNVAKSAYPLARIVALVPSGESPDGTGGSPVLPANHFSNTLLDADLRFEGIHSVSHGPDPVSTGGCLWPPDQNATRGNRTAGQTARLPHFE